MSNGMYECYRPIRGCCFKHIEDYSDAELRQELMRRARKRAKAKAARRPATKKKARK